MFPVSPSFNAVHGAHGPQMEIDATETSGRNEQVATLVNRQTFYDSEPKFSTKPNEVHSGVRMIRLAPFMDHSRASNSPIRTVVRKLNSDGVVRLGRLERADDKNRAIVYTEKVVSRNHAELALINGKWYIRDVGSSSGTFINNERLSPGSTPSPMRLLHTGDVIRFGVDYRGGQESQYRAVSVRVELDGERNTPVTEFQTAQLDSLKKLATNAGQDGGVENCAICLDPMNPIRSLFMAPCGHMWHYRCIRTTLVSKYPFFECPMCRKGFDLEESSDVDVDDDDDDNECPPSSGESF